MVTVLVDNVEVEVNEVPLMRQSAVFRRAWAAESCTNIGSIPAS
jgi:hypothetical protein